VKGLTLWEFQRMQRGRNKRNEREGEKRREEGATA
jgi:hypothetical protein